MDWEIGSFMEISVFSTVFNNAIKVPKAKYRKAF